MSQFERVGSQVVDVNEPVKLGRFLKWTQSTGQQLNELLRRVQNLGHKVEHIESWSGRLQGTSDEHGNRILSAEKRVYATDLALHELTRRVEALEAQMKGQAHE